MTFSIGMFNAKPVYCYTVSMTFDRAGYKYIRFALNEPIEHISDVCYSHLITN